jgi:hypothetical protein
MDFLPIHLALARKPRRVRRASGSHRGIASVSPRHGNSPHHPCAQEDSMKSLLSSILAGLLAGALVCTAAPASYAEPSHQVIQGTQIHLNLLTMISTSSSRDGDPFVAVVAEPVFIGNQLLLPAGTRVNGIIGTVEKARRFSIFRGQAYMNLTFRSVEIDSRIIPVQMSIIALEQPHGQNDDGKRRKDIKIEEGQVLEQKHDYKGDVIGGSVGAGGGALIGVLFSNVARGFGLGLAGSAAYIVARKGKEVELPAQTGMLVRMDNTITVPATSTTSASYSVAH